MEKVSFISTVYNERETIEAFLNSILSQTQKPDEVIIVDAGSNDGTYEIVQKYLSEFQSATIPYGFAQVIGNRSIGRNVAIRQAQYTWIAASDAGCILDGAWLAQLFNRPLDGVDVISGFYSANIGAPTPFQKALAAYTCVMPDRLDENTFLPSSRSVAFTKSAWLEVGGYPEELDTCEDLMFAERLKEAGKKFVMAREAVVYWPQKKTLMGAAKQFYGYAYGDGQAGYIRFQTPLLYGRYVVGFILIAIALYTHIAKLWLLILIMLILYIVWALAKNYRYVGRSEGLYLLPLLQFTADGAVMTGMLHGAWERYRRLFLRKST